MDNFDKYFNKHLEAIIIKIRSLPYLFESEK